MQKGGQAAQVKLLHRQDPGADNHPGGFTLVSAHISVNTSTSINQTNEIKTALNTCPELGMRGVLQLSHMTQHRPLQDVKGFVLLHFIPAE